MSSGKKQFLSETSKIFIKKIAKYFKEGLKQLTSEKEDSNTSITTSEIYTSETSALKKGLKYTYINEEIRQSIETSHWIGQTITFTVHSKKITLHFTYPTLSIKKDLKKVERFFQNIKFRIYSWLYIASLESERGCSTDLTIYFYFTDFKKRLPAQKKVPIDELNVNTGFTFSCSLTESGKNEMYIYRKEEWFKVLIHECFHAFSLDFSGVSRELLERTDREVIQTMFPIHIDLRFYETYCEMWAEILQIIYANIDEIIQDKNINGKNENAIDKWSKFERMLRTDQLHSLKQGAKILKNYHMSYTDLFERTDKAKLKRMEYREVSPVISYYLLKSIFYMHINEYIEWTSVNNRGTLRFLKTELSLKSYIGLLRECYKTPKYIDSMKLAEKTLNQKDTNLRMSCFEIA
jgi:hypothetical protein